MAMSQENFKEYVSLARERERKKETKIVYRN